MTKKQKNILILGGGFAGVKTALELAKLRPDVAITLISNKPNFEYHGALYRIVVGYTIREVCFSLTEILTAKNIRIVQDTISTISPRENQVKGASGTVYNYDTLCIGLGMQTTFFGIKGMEQYSFGMKTIDEALELRHHLHSVIDAARSQNDSSKRAAANIVVVGAGPTGVEVAGELQEYVTSLASERGIETDLVNVYLIEAQSRILPTFETKFSDRIEKRLQSMGVHVHTSCAVQKATANQVFLPDMTLNTKTIIWTAGVQASSLIKDAGLQVDRCGRALVNKHLQVNGHTNIYVAGDAAATVRTGTAQTALYDAQYIAKMIANNNVAPALYTPKQPIYAVPAGKGWAGTQVGNFLFFGRSGWVLRRLVDFVVYRSFFPFTKSLRLLRQNYVVNLCSICLKDS